MKQWKFMESDDGAAHWEELHQYRLVDRCACKRMNFMSDSDSV